MAGSIEGSHPLQVDEKNTIMPQESSDNDFQHHEVVDSGSAESGLHESEKDIPVRAHLSTMSI